MKTIGITGGIGSGKSEVLMHINFTYRCKIILTDEIAHIVKEPGQPCYDKLVELLGKQVLDQDGYIKKPDMADIIFSDPDMLCRANALIHPAVKEYVLSIIKEEKARRDLDFLFVEAALLIEDGYMDILDELWYIYADEEVRRKRLKEIRHYSDEKIDSIMSKQLPDREFRKHCSVIIDNSGFREDTFRQIDEKLGEYLWQK